MRHTSTQHIILARHGRTAGNALQQSGSPESRIVGLSLKDTLDDTGERQADVLGKLLGTYIVGASLDVVSVHSSDATRAIQTRDRAIATSGLATHLATRIRQPDARLRELSKGDQEGQLRRVIYPTPEAEAANNAWNYRHGYGGDTHLEVALRWKAWFSEIVSIELSTGTDKETVIAFGHNSVTANALLLALDYPEVTEDTPSYDLPPMGASNQYTTANGTAIVLSRQEHGLWAVTDRITP